nr:response regulator [Variovorax boronicumulans]
MTAPARLPTVLLVEPQFVMRRTIVAVARELALVEFHEASSVARALPLLQARRFGGMVVDLDDGNDALTLLERLRAGEFACRPDLPVIALSLPTSPAASSRLDAVRPLRTLDKPFKVRELLSSVALLAAL